MRSTTVPALFVAILICSVGCGPKESFFDGGSARVYYSESSVPCQGSAQYLGQITDAAASYLGFPAPAAPIRYHFDPAKVSQHCPEPFGCYLSSTAEIWSASATSAHEIVHAVVGSSLHGVATFFNEGIAVALGGDDVRDAPDYSRQPMDLVTNFGYSAVEYATAGDFVSGIIFQYGPIAFVSFLKQIQGIQAFSDIDAAFSSTFGMTIAQAISSRVQSATRFDNNRLWFPECIATTAIPASAAAAAIPLACDANGVGPDFAGNIFREESFDAEAGGYLLDVENDPRVGIAFHRCPSSDGFTTIFGVPGSTTNAHGVIALVLDAGRYAVTDSMQLTAASSTAAAFSVALSPSPSVSDTCGSLPPLTVDATVSPLYAAPTTGKTVLLSFQSSQPLHRTASGAAGAIDLCTGNCMATGCPAVQPSSTPLAPSTTYTLVVQSSGQDALAGLMIAP